jgi:ribulose 1,5-bisphosphate synthetase/thiazole synthase
MPNLLLHVNLTFFSLKNTFLLSKLDLVFDYIVVGSGPGGSVVANRLSEELQIKVALIEAGFDPKVESHVRNGFTTTPLFI